MSLKESNKFYKYEIGEGIPLIIFHGLFHDGLVMRHVFEDSAIDLSPFKRIYIDLAGMGQSPKHKLENNTDTMLELLKDFIKDLVLDEKFIVCGYSYGGYIAKGIAKLFKDQILAEIEICPVVESDINKRKYPIIKFQDIDETIFNTLDKGKQDYFKQNASVINQGLINGFKDIDRAISRAKRDFVSSLFKNGYESKLIKNSTLIHTHPSLYILGKQDVEVGYQDALDQIQMYSDIQVELMSDASHFLMWEYPDKFLDIMNSFLSKIKADV